MGRRTGQSAVAWLVGAVLLSGCGDDSSGTTPPSDPPQNAGGVTVTCVEQDPTTERCLILEVVRSAPQGQVQLRTTIDLRPPTLDPDAVTTFLDNPGNLSDLLDDMENPAFDVVFDPQAKQTLINNQALQDEFRLLAQNHPERCRLVRLRGISFPICS
jgi:hypothetical protein